MRYVQFHYGTKYADIHICKYIKIANFKIPRLFIGCLFLSWNNIATLISIFQSNLVNIQEMHQKYLKGNIHHRRLNNRQCKQHQIAAKSILYLCVKYDTT